MHPFKKLLRTSLIALLLPAGQAAHAADSGLNAAAMRVGCLPSRVDQIAKSDQMTTWRVRCRAHEADTIVVTCIASECWASATREAEEQEEEDE